MDYSYGSHRISSVLSLIPFGLALPAVIRLYWGMRTTGFEGRTKGPIMGRAAKSYLICSLAFQLGMLLFLELQAGK